MFRKIVIVIALVVVPTLARGDGRSGEDYCRIASLNPVHLEKVTGAKPVEIVVNGKAMASIVVADDKSSIEVKELVEHVKLATGVELPVATAAEKISGNVILLGESALTKAKNIAPADQANGGLRVQTFDGGVAILGGTAGVYDFLERFTGVRWYYPGEDGRVIQKLDELVIPPVHYTDAPVRAIRTMFPWEAKGMNANTDDFAAIQRRYRSGDISGVGVYCHTPPNFAVHFKEHPECFELTAEGKRNPDMPCWSNPETVRLFIKDLEDFYATGRKDIWVRPSGETWSAPSDNTIPIMPNDNAVNCACEFCKPLNRTDSNYAQASEVLSHFVVKVATEVKKRWPDKRVLYCPYWNYTSVPNTVEFPDNVIIQVSLMRGAGNYKEPVAAADHDKWIHDWKKKVPGTKISLWEYLCWPSWDVAFPYQYPHVIQRFQQKFPDDLRGTFINGDAGAPGLAGQQWAYQHLTIYCWFRLLWNPDFNVDAAISEYVELMYGPAKDPMGRIFQLLIKRWEDVQWKEGMLSPTAAVSPSQIYNETAPKEVADELASLLAKARAQAPAGSVYSRRVEFTGTQLDIFLKESGMFHSAKGLPDLRSIKAASAPKLDGVLDEPCWQSAEVKSFVMASDKEHPTPANPSSVRSVWTDEGVYFAFELMERDVAKLKQKVKTHDNSDVWQDDCVELYLDWEGKSTRFAQVIFNSIGTCMDRLSENDPKLWNSDATSGQSVGKDRWTLEVFVPYSATISRVQAGTVWRGNFVRNRYVDGSELQRWSTLFRSAHNDQMAFGRILFVDAQ